ncbi:ArsR family transcriptional regulator [Nonomuraea rosea]|uniref:ArsR family transcriptional regulator n=2 Tax=Nonomuraea rosea TaxID=638574 RepID=A0ABP6ZHL1_9ACTN
MAADPLRWRLVQELALSDRRVRELVTLIGQPQNLISYHLGRLRASGMVTARRSSFDGRDTYYHLDLGRCAQLLTEAGATLHPGLALDPPFVTAAETPGTASYTALFLCTGNSARSQVAEALSRVHSGGRVQGFSAGSQPKPLHPDAVRVMAARGVDIAGQQSKHLSVFAQRHFEYVITLCDKVREVCPPFSGDPTHIHWSIPDPNAPGGGYAAFELMAAEIETRVTFWLAAIGVALSPFGQESVQEA